MSGDYVAHTKEARSRADLANMVRHRARLAERFHPEHQLVRDLTRKIDALKATLENPNN